MKSRTSNIPGYSVALVRQAHRREAERVQRREQLRARAREIARTLRELYGERVRVYLFGSVVDLERYHPDSDLDLAVSGLTPAEYWAAWAEAEALTHGAPLDFVRLESAAGPLRLRIQTEGEEL
jgi:predicted nucleotidyltransferase